MAASSSSDCVFRSTEEKYSSKDGPPEASRAGDQRRTVQDEIPSFMEGFSNSQDDKGNGKEIISGRAGHSDELTAEKIIQKMHDTLRGEDGERMINNPQVSYDGEDMDIQCDCCYWPFRLEDLVQCPNEHLFCFDCIKQQVNQIIYGGLKAHSSLSCMFMGGCEESVPLSEIRRALPNHIIEKYQDHIYRTQAQESIATAKVDGLVYCPFCNILYEVDKCLQVLECPNKKCLQASCIHCKKLDHSPSPLLCEEVQKMPDTLRGEVEERMTKAVIRECNICHA